VSTEGDVTFTIQQTKYTYTSILITHRYVNTIRRGTQICHFMLFTFKYKNLIN